METQTSGIAATAGSIMGLGFGLERIGLAAIRLPNLFASLLLMATLVTGLQVAKVQFDGSLLSILPDNSATFKQYQKQKRDFRDFSRDIAVILRSPRLFTASGLEDVRSIQLELALVDGVSNTASLFSVPEPNSQTGELETFFPPYIETDSQAATLLESLQQRFPASSNLFSRKENTALIILALDLGPDDAQYKKAYRSFVEIKSAVAGIAPADFQVNFAGLTPIGLTILETLVKDQVRLTIMGLVLGALVAMALFRDPVAALVCAVPPALTAIWSVGVLSIFAIPINYLTTILPTLALILAYADGIVMYHHWNRENCHDDSKTADDVIENLKTAVRRIGPATSLTSITTAAAIASFMISSNGALVEFGWQGVLFISFAFFAVIVGLPVTGFFCTRFGLVKPKRSYIPGFRATTALATMSQKFPTAIAAAAVVAAGLMFVMHSQLQPEYRVTDYLPKSSETLAAEEIANSTFGGRSIVLVSVPVVSPGGISNPDNRDRLQEVVELLRNKHDPNRVFAPSDLWRGMDREAEQRIAERLHELGPETRRAYVARDESSMLVSLRIPSSSSITETGDLMRGIEPPLRALEYGDQIAITGFPVLVTNEFTIMINQMRTGLLVAIAFGILIVGIASRSFSLALAVAIPNILPILTMESLMYLRDGTIILTEVVALTIAFGIAIDNAVHVVNFYLQAKQAGRDVAQTLKYAVTEVSPALASSTLIICTSVLVTFTSILPTLPVIGRLVIATLIVALATNLVILPAFIVAIERVAGTVRK